jgi:hypothetical protein
MILLKPLWDEEDFAGNHGSLGLGPEKNSRKPSQSFAKFQI